MVEVFSGRLRELWNSLELHVLVLFSLFLQVILTATGNRRKYTRRKWVTLIVWLAYLSADNVATLALGLLSQNPQTDSTYILISLWGPFLLTHLGGPDTITAYALADNELWSRHTLALFGQVLLAVYVFLRSFVNSPLNYLWLLVFISGLLKYGERAIVLFLASRDKFRGSLVPDPDPGPNYAKFMDEWVSREAEGYIVRRGKGVITKASTMTRLPRRVEGHDPNADVVVVEVDDANANDDVLVLQEAFYFYKTFKRLFADLILSFQDRDKSSSFFSRLTWNKAFAIVEVELGFVYDLFYTKAFSLDSFPGFFLRVFTSWSSGAACIVFHFIDKSAYPKNEVIITYLLFFGAISLEIYAFAIILSSDRMMIRLTGDWSYVRPIGLKKFKGPILVFVQKIVLVLRYLRLVPAKKRWSNAAGQYNLLDCCLESKSVIKCNMVNEYLRKYLFWNSVSIPDGLRELVFKELKARVANFDEPCKRLGSYRGDEVLLNQMVVDRSEERDDKVEVEFDQSVLLWHIATDFCYTLHVEPSLDDSNDTKSKRDTSMWLSNYVIHLLMMSPFMLPSGIGQIRFQDTCAEVKEFFEDEGKLLNKKNICKKLLKVDTRIPPSEVKGDRSKSLLFDACRLVKCLLELEPGQQWEIISQAWLDILTFAAAQCQWNDHAEKLSQGGELLTHVWLLMAHFGMTDHFQISQGYVRAKLELK